IAVRLVLDGRIAPRAVVGLDAALTPWRGVRAELFPLIARAAAGARLPARLFAHRADAAQVRRLLDGVGSRLDPRGVELYRRLLSRAGHAGAALQMMAQWRLEPVHEGLARLGVPLTLVVGERDAAAPPAQAREAAGRAAGSRVELVAGAGHLAHEEAPARVAELIEAAAARAGLPTAMEEDGG
ncbi:MAG: alpha/beta fold hydrolase, partial [Caulobacteraceae bacterium]|nr:alpha/beta fold hydrolase [Caulobacter sp.]